MKDNALKLNDKTILISGPFCSITQSLVTLLTEYGADVALVGPEMSAMKRFTDNVTDGREIHPHFGRAMIVESSLSSESACQDAVSKVAETFGSIDVLIDTHLTNIFNGVQTESSVNEVTDLFEQVLMPSLYMARTSLQFLQGRQKSRMIFLAYDSVLQGLPGEALNAIVRGGLPAFVQALSAEITNKSLCINCVALGVTEDYLLKRYPEANSIKVAFDEHQKLFPLSRIIEASDIASALAFLSSPLSAALSGQTLRMV